MRLYSKYKYAYILVLILLICAILLASSHQKICDVINGRSSLALCVSTFPASLEHIADSAFENTALYNVFFEDGLLTVGAKAFAEISQLKDLFIPASVSYIARDAFPDSVIMHVTQGSLAQSWAEDNGYRYVVDDVWAENNEYILRSELLILILCFAAIPDYTNMFHLDRIALWVEKSMRPQDRPELYPINYRFP